MDLRYIKNHILDDHYLYGCCYLNASIYTTHVLEVLLSWS
jgi:hypothetical protein